MKTRLPALDGLRGFAAFAVLLSHTGYSPSLFIPNPIIITAYQTLAVGPNSVQILFVLSGFLMAFLYPSIPVTWKYIQKRYARIFPILGVVITSLWLISQIKGSPYYLQALIFLGTALGVFFLWKLFKASMVSRYIGKVLFFGFVSLQIILVFLNIFITPRFFANPGATDITNILTLLSNLTLTTPFAKDILRLSGVVWSLAPEVLFYVVYPFIVIPLIYVCKKLGIFFSVLCIAAVTIILFNLDYAIVPFAGLQSMNIARASGFVAGVVLGTIYQSNGKIWQKLLPFVSNPFSVIFILLLFVGLQWGDTHIRHGQSIVFMNYYYLVSSWIIALLIASAIVPKTLSYKIFSTKMLVFLGLISYSLYLSHTHIIEWVNKATMSFPNLNDTFVFFLMIILGVAVASYLFYFIERLYFKSKRDLLETTLASSKEKVRKASQSFSTRRVVVTAFCSIAIIFYLYSGSFSPTLLLSRHPITAQTSELQVSEKALRIPFKAKDQDLSAIYIRLRYAQEHPSENLERGSLSKFTIRLLDGKNKEIATYTRDANTAEGSPFFGFGIPVIVDAKGKDYVLELSSKRVNNSEELFVDTSSTSLVTVYSQPKLELLQKPYILLLNRIIYVVTDPGFVFAVVSIIIISSATTIKRKFKRNDL